MAATSSTSICPSISAPCEDLEVEVHLVDVERDVLLGLPADRLVELLAGHARQADLLHDHRVAGDRGRDLLGLDAARSRSPRGSPRRWRPSSGRRPARSPPAEAGATPTWSSSTPLVAHRALDRLHGRRADVEADDRLRLSDGEELHDCLLALSADSASSPAGARRRARRPRAPNTLSRSTTRRPSAIRIWRLVSRRHGRPASMRSMVSVDSPARSSELGLAHHERLAEALDVVGRHAPPPVASTVAGGPTPRPAVLSACPSGRLEPAATARGAADQQCSGSRAAGRGSSPAARGSGPSRRGAARPIRRARRSRVPERILVVDDDEALRESLAAGAGGRGLRGRDCRRRARPPWPASRPAGGRRALRRPHARPGRPRAPPRADPAPARGARPADVAPTAAATSRSRRSSAAPTTTSPSPSSPPRCCSRIKKARERERLRRANALLQRDVEPRGGRPPDRRRLARG